MWRAYGACNLYSYGSQPLRAGLPGNRTRDAEGANVSRAYGAPALQTTDKGAIEEQAGLPTESG